jgi:hypothetical protein
MKTTKPMIAAYIQMGPRAVYTIKDGNRPLESVRKELRQKPGIYILYQNEKPYYVGQAKNLWIRLRTHALNQNAKHYHHWTHFSAFSLADVQHINELEGLIIAAFGTETANGSRRRKKRGLLPNITARFSLLRDFRLFRSYADLSSPNRPGNAGKQIVLNHTVK